MRVQRLPYQSALSSDQLTVHEVRRVDSVAPSLRIAIGQDPVVRELPAEGIGYDHNQSPWLPRRWICDIGREAVDRLNPADRSTLVQRASEAVSASHSDVDNDQLEIFSGNGHGAGRAHIEAICRLQLACRHGACLYDA